MSSDNDDRISELETQVTFLEDSIGTLDGALVRQQLRLEELEVVVREMRQRLKTQVVKVEALQDGDEPPPPHY